MKVESFCTAGEQGACFVSLGAAKEMSLKIGRSWSQKIEQRKTHNQRTMLARLQYRLHLPKP
jgi:hypothetical protein